MAALKQDPADTRERVGVREFRGGLSEFLQRVRRGESFLITSRDEVIAEIRPPASPARPPRMPGALRGQIWMSDDLDSLPEDILAAMTGDAG